MRARVSGRRCGALYNWAGPDNKSSKTLGLTAIGGAWTFISALSKRLSGL
jgi:hypothetical protein